MSYQAVFTGWEDLKLKDLLVAYRKAKADCFFENTFPTAVKFAEYEQKLLPNLKKHDLFIDNYSFSGFMGDFFLQWFCYFA